MAIGYGDLKQGFLACKRVSETVARMELAKKIRVFVTGHAIDRVREQTGKPVEQDIEILREERVNELLHDVKIVSFTTDETAGVCTSTAVMPKRVKQLSPSSPEATPK